VTTVSSPTNPLIVNAATSIASVAQLLNEHYDRHGASPHDAVVLVDDEQRRLGLMPPSRVQVADAVGLGDRPVSLLLADSPAA